MGRDVGPLPVPTGTGVFGEGSSAEDAAHGFGSSFMPCCSMSSCQSLQKFLYLLLLQRLGTAAWSNSCV